MWRSLGRYHDSNLCVARDGNVELVLELERVWDIRHFASTESVYEPMGGIED